MARAKVKARGKAKDKARAGEMDLLAPVAVTWPKAQDSKVGETIPSMACLMRRR